MAEEGSQGKARDPSRHPRYPNDGNICRIANVMVHKILLPSSDGKTLHGEKCSCWGLLGSTMSPVPMNTRSPMGNPAPSATQQPTGLVWINYLNYCSNFLLQTSTFPGRKQPYVYYIIPLSTWLLNTIILSLIINILIIITPPCLFPKTIGHLKVITLNPRHDSYWDFFKLFFFLLFFSFKCLLFSENGLNISVSHLMKHFPTSNSWKMGLYIICRKISLPLKYTSSEDNDEQPTSILHYRGTSPVPFSNVPCATSD